MNVTRVSSFPVKAMRHQKAKTTKTTKEKQIVRASSPFDAFNVSDERGKRVWSEAQERSEALREIVQRGLEPIHEELKSSATADIEKVKEWFDSNVSRNGNGNGNSSNSSSSSSNNKSRRKWTTDSVIDIE
jgi:hypothetical protein